MTKVRFHPLLEHLRGSMKGMVFRLSHNGKISVYASPDMSRVKWSQAQVAHRERMAESFAYATQAMANPEIREIYLQMALEKKKNKRPYDMAVWDYYHNGNNLLGSKFFWNVENWRAMKKYCKRKKW
jgi:hypothetical protein